MGGRTIRPRGEARAFDPGELTEGQRSVIADLFAWARGFVTARTEEDCVKGGTLAALTRVQRERRSNVVLIEGARGSGKTSTLLTLIDLWGRAIRVPSPEADPKDPEEWRDAHLDEPLKGNLVPLEPIDLQLLPVRGDSESTSDLLACICGRINDLIVTIEDAARPARTKADWDDAGEPLASRRAWQRLMRSAAIGWRMKLEDRSARVDPETFAVEFEQAEREQLSVPLCWRRLITELMKEANAWFPQVRAGARLVISIDDVDMVPEHAPSLLQLLRTLAHPQVIFVITGDSQLFLKGLVGDRYRRVAAALQGLGGVPRNIIEEMHDETLSKQILDKDVPPAQRFSLNPLPRGTRIQLLARLAPGATERDSIREVFKAHSGALPEFPRGLANFAQKIDRAHAEVEDSRAFRARVARLTWSEACDRVDAPWLAEQLRETRRHALELENAIGCAFTWGTSEPWFGTLGRERALGNVPTIAGEIADVTLVGRTITGVEAHVGGTTLEGKEADVVFEAADIAIQLSRGSAQGWFQLAMPEAGVLGQASILDASLVVARVLLTQIDDDGDVEMKTAYFPWPIPDYHVQPSALRRWASEWAEVGHELDDERALAVEFAACLTFVDRLRREAAPWEFLFSKAGLAEVGAGARRMWIEKALVLLAAPESGLPANVANELLHAWQGAKFNPGATSAVRRLRARRAQQVFEGRAISDVLDGIDAQYPEHEFGQVIKTAAPVARKAKSSTPK